MPRAIAYCEPERGATRVRDAVAATSPSFGRTALARRICGLTELRSERASLRRARMPATYFFPDVTPLGERSDVPP